MLSSKMPCSRSALLFVVGTIVLASSVTAQQDKFVYKFSQGAHAMVCTNWPTGVSCTNPPPYAMNTAGSSDSHRNIISFDSDGNYALGFEKATFGSWYLSIYTYHPSTKSSGPSIWRATSELDAPHLQVPGNSSLIFLPNGNLELRDPKGGLRWTPDAGGLGVTEFVFNARNPLKSVAGNMVLYNSQRQVVWQSMLPQGGNKFKLNMIHRPDMVCTNLNNPPRVDCVPNLEYPMHPSVGVSQYRNIISSKSAGKYALGFGDWQDSGSQHFCLAIYKWNPSTKRPSGVPIWKAVNHHGKYNPATPIIVTNGASITFRQNGDLELRDHKKKLIWTTGIKGRASDLEFSFDTGSLYLYNLQGAIVWRAGAESSLSGHLEALSKSSDHEMAGLDPDNGDIFVE